MHLFVENLNMDFLLNDQQIHDTWIKIASSSEIMKSNINILKSNIQETTKIFENGLTEEENLEQLQLTLSNLEINLKNLETLHDISKGYLKLLLGVDSENDIILTDNLNTLVSENISLELLNNEFSVLNNLDYKLAENDATSKGLLYKLEKSKMLPPTKFETNTRRWSAEKGSDF